MRFPDAIERLWRSLLLRGTATTSAYRRLAVLYTMDDPWNMASTREQHRFAATAEMIAAIAPRYGSMLELGCGEGHQSQFLAPLADDYHGIDLSARAIERAKRRCPGASFARGKIEDLPQLFPGRRFDLVTACEVFYYLADPAVAIAKAQAHARRLFVTNYQARAEPLRALLHGPGWTQLPDIVSEDTLWECRLWTSEEAQSARTGAGPETS